MHAQAKPYSEMIKINSQLKKQHGLKLAVVNSEGRELNDNRIKETSLNDFIDFFFLLLFAFA
jgi:hypothetical protein